MPGDAESPAGPSLDTDATEHRVAESGGVYEGQRLQLCLEGRYVTVLRVKGQLTCIDSICFHAGGPLGIGDIEEVAGKPCLVCPWHHYKIDAITGEKYYQAAAMKDGKMVPGPWRSNGQRQRVHPVEERPDGVYVRLNLTDAVASDEYACNEPCGVRVLHATGGRGSNNVGADGKLREKSGGILSHLKRLTGQ